MARAGDAAATIATAVRLVRGLVAGRVGIGQGRAHPHLGVGRSSLMSPAVREPTSSVSGIGSDTYVFQADLAVRVTADLADLPSRAALRLCWFGCVPSGTTTVPASKALKEVRRLLCPAANL